MPTHHSEQFVLERKECSGVGPMATIYRLSPLEGQGIGNPDSQDEGLAPVCGVKIHAQLY